MNKPDDVKKFYKDNNNKELYCIRNYNSYGQNIVKCKLGKCENRLTIVILHNGKESPFESYVDWECLFCNEKEAQQVIEYSKNLCSKFRYNPLVGIDIISNHVEELLLIEKKIDDSLLKYENYNGIDFCDVHAGGIQVRIHHKLIKGYTYGNQHTILYDFSNKDEIPDDVINEFIEIDNPKSIESMQRFIREGEKYGWD